MTDSSSLIQNKLTIYKYLINSKLATSFVQTSLQIKVHSSVAHSAMKVMSVASKMPFKYMKWPGAPEVS